MKYIVYKRVYLNSFDTRYFVPVLFYILYLKLSIINYLAITLYNLPVSELYSEEIKYNLLVYVTYILYFNTPFI